MSMSARDKLPPGLAPEAYEAFEEWERSGGQPPPPPEVLDAMRSAELDAHNGAADLVLMRLLSGESIGSIRGEFIGDAKRRAWDDARGVKWADGHDVDFVLWEMTSACEEVNDALDEIADPDYLMASSVLDHMRELGVDDGEIARRMESIRVAIGAEEDGERDPALWMDADDDEAGADDGREGGK